MDDISKLYVRLSEGNIAKKCVRWSEGRGQTMTEYAMIVSAVAVAVLAGYKTMGTGVQTLAASIDGQL